MRTNIDDELLATAQKASGLTTKQATVDQSLQLPVQLTEQQDILRLAGKVKWQGNLEKSRG